MAILICCSKVLNPLVVGDFERMATEAPGWADQWGAGGIGALEDGDNTKATENSSNNKKADTKSGLGKAKVAAMAGAEKIKNGTSNGIKWIKNQCQKKKPSKPVN
ncbi:unnamed protein product [Prunus armeniaca]|uniref:Uncharacterized protein n=4 Tax=Prunus TaxID=3754 RepID=A0A6J5UHH2_PRUAR|nr:unnamed protein product [Prunus armeniaca]